MITEASPLTYPENASTSEDNCVLFQKGNRTRRLGFEREQEGVLSGFTMFNSVDRDVHEYMWEGVNDTGLVDVAVQRVGQFLFFFDANAEVFSLSQYTDPNAPVATLAGSIDMNQFAIEGGLGSIADTKVEFSSGRGLLFVVGEHIEPFSVEFIPSSQTFLPRLINIQIRDFVGLDDGLANDFEPTELSAAHHYNLRNQGWVAPSSKVGNTTTNTDNTLRYSLDNFLSGTSRLSRPALTVNFTSSPIDQYFDQIGLYPGNNKAWWVGKLEVDNPDKGLVAGDFDPDILCDTFVGNTLAARGHFIFNAFNKNRSEVSGIDQLPSEISATRPASTAFYAGKVWYAHRSDVYYSQTLIDHRQAGNCYQEADPTSETISDLIATDGGIIPIPEALNIRKIHPVGGSLVVFADNGVWSVQGGEGGFSATNISVNKVSSNGILGARTLVEANSVIYWWSNAGIMSLSQRSGLFGAQEGSFDRENITETTIRSFYHNNIPVETKMHAKGIYDPIRNLVQWMYKSEDSKSVPNVFFDRILNLDVTLQAFYPWTIDDSQGRAMTGFHNRVLVNVINTPGIETQEGLNTFNSYVRYVYADFSNDSRVSRFGYGDFQAQDYSDFGDQPYLSFMETGFEILEDLMRNKQSNYVFLYFRRTDDEDLGIDSSCFFQTKWDWSRNYESGRWSRKVQGYRITRNFKDNHVVSTKHKARGHGRALQVRFESAEIGTTFDLLGWATNYTGNTTV